MTAFSQLHPSHRLTLPTHSLHTALSLIDATGSMSLHWPLAHRPHFFKGLVSDCLSNAGAELDEELPLANPFTWLGMEGRDGVKKLISLTTLFSSMPLMLVWLVCSILKNPSVLHLRDAPDGLWLTFHAELALAKAPATQPPMDWKQAVSWLAFAASLLNTKGQGCTLLELRSHADSFCVPLERLITVRSTLGSLISPEQMQLAMQLRFALDAQPSAQWLLRTWSLALHESGDAQMLLGWEQLAGDWLTGHLGIQPSQPNARSSLSPFN